MSFAEAAKAVKEEYRANCKPVLLSCLQVEQPSGSDESIFAVRTARFAEMDWTWEGARAIAVIGADEREYRWGGEVVEVDTVGSRVFIRSDSLEKKPTIGDFRVYPYEFLAALNRLYNDAPEAQPFLREALSIAEGSFRAVEADGSNGIPALAQAWSRSVGYLWGPPGTGKTFTSGEQIAQVLLDGNDRFLVVSTTNKATDEIALAIGRSLQRRGASPSRSLVCRVGSGANIETFKRHGLEALIVGGDADLREQLASLLRRHAGETNAGRRAELWSRIQDVRLALSAARPALMDVDSRVIVATAHAAISDLTHPDTITRIAEGVSTFTTVIADEAGLIARASAAALSLFASQRFFLVGDPRQLSPISKISRVLPSAQAKWVSTSALHGVHRFEGVHRLTEQHRMAADIRAAVSHYQYDDTLVDARSIAIRVSPLPRELHDSPKAVWYVIDEDSDEAAHIRAERGPGNKSWVRKRSTAVLERLFKAHPGLKSLDGLFISPFVAQPRMIASWLHEERISSWHASTVHRQQGAEADIVVFDSVNASSTAWPHDEWKRLINVGISRARHKLIVIASRAEMREPYMAPLRSVLRPRVLKASGGQFRWVDVDVDAREVEVPASAVDENLIGAQLASRKVLRPILSSEQQRLSEFPLDGKPRLVRGVAGSGKTAVLASWLARRLAAGDGKGPLWVVYANASLKGVLQRAIMDAWEGVAPDHEFPWHRVHLFHLLELFQQMEQLARIGSPAGKAAYDFGRRAKLLSQCSPVPACSALFIDEAQDFGEEALAYLTQLVEPVSPDRPSEKSINIFYDNAQNVYGRGTPTWSTLGLDMRGRSTVMKESFRSTRPITELALNVLYRLVPPAADPDHAELIERDLIYAEERNGREWWRAKFNQVDGPPPEFRIFPTRDEELAATVEQIRRWVVDEHVRPSDIRVIANDPHIRTQLVRRVTAELADHHVRCEEQARQSFEEDGRTVIVTTAHSYKGHESEIVVVVAADKFMAAENDSKKLLPQVLYVAMTRARSILYVSSIQRDPLSPAAKINQALHSSLEDLRSAPAEVRAVTEAESVLEHEFGLTDEQRKWFRQFRGSHEIAVRPVLRSSDGSLICEPTFCATATDGRKLACFAAPPSSYLIEQLEDEGYGALQIGC